MNIDDIVNRIKSIPKDKLNDEETLRELLKIAAKESGKAYSEGETDQLLERFKNIFQEGSTTTLISILLKHGITLNQLEDFQKKLDTPD